MGVPSGNPTAFQQDTGASVQGAGIIKKTKVEIDGQVGELDTIMRALGDSWKSKASTDYDDLMRRWREQVTRLANVMEQASVDLTTGAQTMQDASNTMDVPGAGAPVASGGGRITQGLSGE